MAERLKTNLLEEEKLVDLVAGPDSYRDLPGLIEEVDGGQKAVNVLLSRDETYADISPVRLDKNGVTGFVSITRGCDNRSEEHTSELQSRPHLVCRLLLEKKKK